MYDPYEHAEHLGIDVIHRTIKSADGFWYPGHRVIVIRSGMTTAYDKSTLAHEVAHAMLGHTDSCPKNERMADRIAAENMINMKMCASALKWVPDAHILASELGVTIGLVRVFLALHQLELQTEQRTVALPRRVVPGSAIPA